MLDLDHQHAGKAGRGPVAEELVRVLGLHAVVAVEPEACAVDARDRGVRRCLPPAADGLGEVAVKDHQRIARVGVLVEPLRQQHMGAEEYRPTPELGQQPALNTLVADVPGRRGIGNGWNLLIEHQSRRGGSEPAIDSDPTGRAVPVAGLSVPLLPFASIRGELEHAAVRQPECFVAVEHCLDPVAAGRQRAQAPDGISERRRSHPLAAPRAPAFHVETEDLLG